MINVHPQIYLSYKFEIAFGNRSSWSANKSGQYRETAAFHYTGLHYASIIQRVSLEWEVRYAMEITHSQLLREGNGNMEVFWVVL